VRESVLTTTILCRLLHPPSLIPSPLPSASCLFFISLFSPPIPVLPFSPQTSPLYCTFLTRFASPKLPTNLLPFHEDFSSDCQYRHALESLNEQATDSYSLAGFCSHYGEPIESHGDSVDSLPGNEQESSPAPFDSTIVTSTVSHQAVNLPRRFTCLRSVT
jgi:hypothetical protein